MPINYSDDLLEVKSSLQGKTLAYVSSNFPRMNLFASLKNNVVGEGIADVEKRMQRFTQNIIKQYEGKNIVVVGHGDPIMILKAQKEGLPMTIDSIRPTKGYIQVGEIYIAEF